MKSFKTNIMLMILVGGWLAVSFSCKEDKQSDYIDSTAPAPAQLDKNSITVKDIPGGSVIFYRIPKDENLLYVKAIYTIAPDVTREAKASIYCDSLMVEGFAVAGDYDVNLYSVGKNKKESDPIVVSISPKTPPIISAWETLTLAETFGGIIGSFQNESKVPLTAILLADTSHTGIFTQLRAFTRDLSKVSFDFLDLDTLETDFRVYLKDHYGNTSEPKAFRLKPWFQEEIPKTTWAQYTMPSDYDVQTEPHLYKFEYLWDGISNQENSRIFATSNAGPPFPYHFTIRLGVNAIISRLALHHRINFEYISKTPKRFEMWGSESNSPDDDLFGGDWFLLGDFTSSKPSGSTDNTTTAEDKLYANGEGEKFLIQPSETIPNPYLPVRYIRFRVFEVWDGGLAGQVIIAEIDLFGRVVK
ncbi:MAG: DUF4959 domain-containing protein [Bacteroidales bacterium]|jgi:hypothetical protein|nr:DUF4959 domain-containing protein [Bacteroidales bacterium]